MARNSTLKRTRTVPIGDPSVSALDGRFDEGDESSRLGSLRRSVSSSRSPGPELLDEFEAVASRLEGLGVARSTRYSVSSSPLRPAAAYSRTCFVWVPPTLSIWCRPAKRSRRHDLPRPGRGSYIASLGHEFRVDVQEPALHNVCGPSGFGWRKPDGFAGVTAFPA